MLKMDDLIWEFLYDCEVRKLTTRTLRSYRNHLLYFNKYLKEVNVEHFEDISPSIIKMFIKKQSQKGLKATYINSGIKVFKAFYKWVIVEEYVDSANNPMDKVRFAKEEQPLIETFTNEEVKEMMGVYKGHGYFDARNKAILAMLFDTGIRNNELCVLSSSAIKDNYILIMGKGNKERVVPISAYLSKMLKRYERAKQSYFEFRDYNPHYYFLSRTGKPLTVASIERVIDIAGKKVNVREDIRCSPHTARHYFAQTQLKNGNDIYTISRLLGHSNISITRTYIQSMKDEDILDKSVVYSPLMNLDKGAK